MNDLQRNLTVDPAMIKAVTAQPVTAQPVTAQPVTAEPDSPLSVSSGDWQWQSWAGKPYLTSRLLSPWRHGFFTQHCWPQPPGKLTAALEAASGSGSSASGSSASGPAAGTSRNLQTYRVKQVHGNVVLNAADLSPVNPSLEENTSFEFADGLMSAVPDQALWVCSADCTPVLLGDTRTGQVSALHAGWRGTAARIVPVAVAQLQSQGSRLTDLRVALGPAIAGEVYQVDEAVAAKAGRSLLAIAQQSDLSDGEVLAQLRALDPCALFPDPTPGKVRLHVRQISALQLLELGFDPEHISVAPHCTYQDPEHFFSYRRTGEKKVQWSGIASGFPVVC